MPLHTCPLPYPRCHVSLASGLGKTLEVAALVLMNPMCPPVMPPNLYFDACPPHVLEAAASKLPLVDEHGNRVHDRGAGSPAFYAARSTLIVTPMTINDQWTTEIEHHCPGLSVVVYRGREDSDLRNSGSRYTSIVELVTADVVVISYVLARSAAAGVGWVVPLCQLTVW